MNVRYNIYNYEFDRALWAQTINDAIASIGRKELAVLVGVDESTLSNWAHMTARENAKWPAMHNFMAVINLLDLTPNEFFVLEDK